MKPEETAYKSVFVYFKLLISSYPELMTIVTIGLLFDLGHSSYRIPILFCIVRKNTDIRSITDSYLAQFYP